MGNCVASGGTKTVTAAGAAGEDGRRRGRRWKTPREEQLGSVPGRIFSNDGRSRTAAVFTQQGRKGINQDAMLVWDVSHRISLLVFPVPFRRVNGERGFSSSILFHRGWW